MHAIGARRNGADVASGDAFRQHAMPPVAPGERAAFAAWRQLLQAHGLLVAGLDDALRRLAGMPLGWYDVLVHIGEAPGCRIRLRELERRVLVSQSSVSRLAARLERDGLLTRTVPPEDRRAVEVTLSPEGVRRLAHARGVAMEYLREHFVARLEPGEDRLVLDALRRVCTGGYGGAAAPADGPDTIGRDE